MPSKYVPVEDGPVMKGIIFKADDLQKKILRQIFSTLHNQPKNNEGWVEAFGEIGLMFADLSIEIENAKDIVK